MARITVEDCLDHVDNRFELVMVGSRRARQIAVNGREPLVESDRDKPTVLALREIAEGLVSADILHEEEETMVKPSPKVFHFPQNNDDEDDDDDAVTASADAV